MEIAVNNMLCKEVGSPTLIMGNKYSLRILKEKTLQFLKSSLEVAFTTNKVVTIACAKTVAIAAPSTPKPGRGPRPKIKMGSKIRLMNKPTKVQVRMVRLEAIAVKIPVNVWLIKEKITIPQVIRR